MLDAAFAFVFLAVATALAIACLAGAACLLHYTVALWCKKLPWRYNERD